MPDVLHDLRALRAHLPPPVDVVAHARDVVVLASSSRGGSSIFAEVLRRSRQLLHFRAEVNPFLRLVGVEGVDGDAVPADTPIPPELGTLLGWDCGEPARDLASDDDVARFAVEWACRLRLQWPELRVPLGEVVAGVESAVGVCGRRAPDVQALAVHLLLHLRRRYPTIHPGAYDLDRALVERHFGALPPFLPVDPVEEPPFVLVAPWRPATAEDLATRPLIVKTPSNVYRLGWLARVFPGLRVLHLRRNAAASINGLYDGWRYPGFHAWRTQLAIPGYTGEVPGGDVWWKFDRPPGWSAYRTRPIAEVCTFQWVSAHQAALAWGDVHPLRFEDVLGPSPRPALEGLARWLGVPVADELAAVLAGALPVVMATHQPRHRRWFARLDLLAPLLARDDVRATMAGLGYGEDPATWG